MTGCPVLIFGGTVLRDDNLKRGLLMRKRALVSTTLLLSSLILSGGTGFAADNEVKEKNINIKISAAIPTSLPVLKTIHDFAENLSTMSNGSIKAKVYDPGKLASWCRQWKYMMPCPRGRLPPDILFPCILLEKSPHRLCLPPCLSVLQRTLTPHGCLKAMAWISTRGCMMRPGTM